MAQDLFSVPIFFILFRETTEASIIVSVLLSFLKQVFSDDKVIYRRLCKQVWLGSLIGLGICLAVGAAFIAVWYTIASDLWANSENIWEGCFSVVASILITVMGLAMLRTEKMQDKWKIKLAKSMESQAGKGDIKTKTQRYAFFILPFVTVLREGLEAIVFLGGVSLGETAQSIPIAAIMGIICGCLVGYLLYRGGSLVKLHWFFVVSTCILYLVAAGLLSKSVGYFEQNAWDQVIGGESAESGGEVINYKVTTAVWHVSWGDPELNTNSNGGWEIFNAILGWNNTATIGTIVTYCGYWVVIAAALVYLRFKEKRDELRTSLEDKLDVDAAIEKAAAIMNKKDAAEEETVVVEITDKV